MLISVGIGYTAEYRKQVQSRPLRSLENFKIPLKFTFKVNHSKEMFTKPITRSSKQYANAFVSPSDDDYWTLPSASTK